VIEVVAFGGGKGLSTLLRGLVSCGAGVRTTAIVAVTDDGGSSGELRRTRSIPALGDARRCLSAVAETALWGRLLEHRFKSPPALEGHTLGNLLLLAAHDETGSLSSALSSVSMLIGAGCLILPMSDLPCTLVARRADGRMVRGQHVLSKADGPLRRVWTNPEIVRPAPGVLEAIASADVIVLGPGSLFSSVIAATRAAGVARAIARSGALKVFVQNLTTQRGETDGFGAVEHVRAVQAHLGERAIDVVLSHRWGGVVPARAVVKEARSLSVADVRVVGANIADETAGGRLHDPKRLAAALLRVASIRTQPWRRRVRSRDADVLRFDGFQRL
jgi:uncharacterized cofD-like protein